MESSTAAVHEKNNVSRKNVIILACVSLGYMLLSRWLVGFKTDQLVLVAIVNFLYFAHPLSRKFVTGFSIFILYWVIYDYMRAWPNYWFNLVHIQDLYTIEKTLFGIKSGTNILTPNEFWQQHSTTFLDILSGIFYLSWVPVPIAFAVFLFFKNRQVFIYFLLTFLLVNLLGFVVYYLYPAAPPWYVQQYGFTFTAQTPGNTAGLSKFDAFFNVALFRSLYAKGSNVFAAMPSLHSAYPLIVFYYAVKNKLGFINMVFGMIMVGIWFAAVYTAHHYVLDVLAGIVCALLGIGLFNWLVRRNNFISRAVNGLVTAIR
jgi:membrane-associated phospholipid phosphatase